MKLIPLTQGLFAQVDDEDFDFLNQWKWYTSRNKHQIYAARNETIDGKQKTIKMHCVIMKHVGVDHIDRNGLNNQRFNLRVASNQNNSANKDKTRKKTSSKYKGVVRYRNDKWKANIKYNGKTFHLGYFFDEIEAAKAYDKKARELFGEFAKTNFDTCKTFLDSTC